MAVVYRASPFAIWSGPGLRFGHGAIRPFLSVYIALALVEETGRYVPSNAVGAGAVCAFAAASRPKNPTIEANSPRHAIAREWLTIMANHAYDLSTSGII